MSHRFTHVLLLPMLLGLPLGCGDGGGAPVDGSNDGPPPDHTGPETGPGDGPAADGKGWTTVDGLLAARAAAAGVGALGLTVWNANDTKVYERMVGGFTADTRVAIASASKLVSTLVIFDVIRRGQLNLDSTTGQVLGWMGPKAAINLRHLLSFTSGLRREAACTINPLVTLAACVEAIGEAAPLAPPATRFDYGSTHLHVAARMAEVATGRSWEQLFAEVLRTPLSLPTEVAYFTFPRQALGGINPLIAGGLRASSNDYAKFLALAFHKGSLGTVTVGTPELFDEQTREPFADVTIGYTPFAAARYGLGSWVTCATPAQGCSVVTSPGAFGFTPWLDRKTGYYAILAMELDGNGSDDRPAAFAVSLLEEVQPLIRAEIGH